MGGPKKLRKKYTNPRKPWEGARIESEKKVKEQYGLKNKHEIRIAQAELRKIRRLAREYLSMGSEGLEQGKIILQRLIKLGIANEKTTLDDLLALDVHSVLGRRLQSVVLKKGLAKTTRQARHIIAHGHIAINGKRVTAPGYLVKVTEEPNVTYYGNYTLPVPVVSDSGHIKEDKKEVDVDGGKEE